MFQLKKEKNNSVHEESIRSFSKFLKELGASDDIIEALLKYQWADGTIDDTGRLDYRLKGTSVVNVYYEEMVKINNFFNDNKVPIINRVLSVGAYEQLDSHIDYIYHGTVDSGVWCSLEYAISVNNNPDNNKKPISIGFLTYQNQNRNATFNPHKEHARNQIQFKWSNMESIIEKSMKTRSRIQTSVKVIGNNSHGFENVVMVQSALNGSRIQNLKPNLKKFIIDLFPNYSSSAIVTCETINHLEKGSLDISVGIETTRVLIKSGSGNSIHQEEFEDFL